MISRDIINASVAHANHDHVPTGLADVYPVSEEKTTASILRRISEAPSAFASGLISLHESAKRHGDVTDKAAASYVLKLLKRNMGSIFKDKSLVIEKMTELAAGNLFEVEMSVEQPMLTLSSYFFD